MFLGSTPVVGMIGWWRENGAMNKRAVGDAEGDRGGFRFEHSKFKILNSSTDIQVEFREEAQAGNTMKGIISIWMMVEAMRLNEVTKEVLGKREEQRTIG